MSARPLVGITGCSKSINDRSWAAVAQKYVEAALDAVGVMPLVIPPVGAVAFAGRVGAATLDKLLPLIRRAVETGVPVFAICRGIQEVNVALGGTLCQHVHEREDRSDHRSPRSPDVHVNYAPAHPVILTEGGWLHRLLQTREIQVNSLHGQGIDCLAPGLRGEATAPDGQIEAVTYPSARGFFLGVQWHPEFRARDNVVSMAMFSAFAAACRQRAGGERAAGPMALAAE
jgi:putative glutamine amidotransferase